MCNIEAVSVQTIWWMEVRGGSQQKHQAIDYRWSNQQVSLRISGSVAKQTLYRNGSGHQPHVQAHSTSRCQNLTGASKRRWIQVSYSRSLAENKRATIAVSQPRQLSRNDGCKAGRDLIAEGPHDLVCKQLGTTNGTMGCHDLQRENTKVVSAMIRDHGYSKWIKTLPQGAFF